MTLTPSEDLASDPELGSAQTKPEPRIWTRILATVVCFAALEGGLFHTPLYSTYMEPDSTTGYMEVQLRNELRRPKSDRNQVLAVGHSRMSLLPRVVNQDKPGTGYTFASIGVGGTTPRDWYYSMRALDPSAHTYAAIVIPSDDFNDFDTFDYQDNREADLHYMLARLELRDLLIFPWTFQSPKLRWLAFRGILLKGFVYKRDLQEFLAHPLARITKVRFYSDNSAGWYYGFGGSENNVVGINIDWQHQTVHFPDRMTLSQREAFPGMLFPPRSPVQGRQTAFLLYWYQKMIDYYRGTGTKLIFMRVPRAPISPPDPTPKLDSAVRQIAKEPGVVVLDEHVFDQLEHPEDFWDAWHLNRVGMEAFSRLLAKEARRELGPPR